MQYLYFKIQFPPYMTHDSFCKGFNKFLNKLNLPKVNSLSDYNYNK